VDDEQVSKRLTELMGPLKLLIADGHHRYETALAYRDMCNLEAGAEGQEHPWDFVMATMVSFRNPGLVIFPAHRLISGLDRGHIEGLRSRLTERFILTDKNSPEELASATEASDMGSFGVWCPAGRVCAVARPRQLPDDDMGRLSVMVLQEEVLKGMFGYTQDMIDEKMGLDFVKGTDGAVAAMATGEHQACFFVKPPTAHEVMTIASSGRKMPQKSTYFFPKMWSGTLLHLH
jgi:uncharacterized protein (DUF1015 family)